MIYNKESDKTLNSSPTSSYHQNLITSQYLGLKNLFINHFNSIRLIEYQIIILVMLLISTFFMSYLLSFIVLATFLEFNPLDTFVGTYNFDSTTNYQFNPYLLILLILFFSICLTILFAQFILAFDVRKAELSDSIMNTAIDCIHEKINAVNNNTTDEDLRKYFIEKNATKVRFNFNNIIAIMLFAFISVFLVMIWILVKS